jgi:preprotein translocase SecF subunit
MLRFFDNANFNFLGAGRRAFLWATALFAVVGFAVLGVRGLNESIEFTGGTLIQIRAADSTMTIGRVRDVLQGAGITGSELSTFGTARDLLIRTPIPADAEDTDAAAQAAAQNVGRALTAAFGAGSYTVNRVEAIGPKVGGELRTRALLAVLLSFAAILVYLTFRFEWRFGVAAIAATVQDVVLTIAFIALMDIELSLIVVAAILTIEGYSLNDKIVVFDRVRENLHKFKRQNFPEILNRSVNETLPRTVLTGGSVLAALLALLILAGPVIRPLAWVMTFGIISGTFSSMYTGAPVLLAIERRWPGEDVRGTKTITAAGPAPGAPTQTT